jgi:hypothetical protein
MAGTAEGDQNAALVTTLMEVMAMRERLDALEYATVQLVRSCGATWETIGDDLGISRQAARQRFGQPRRRRS